MHEDDDGGESATSKPLEDDFLQNLKSEIKSGMKNDMETMMKEMMKEKEKEFEEFKAKQEKINLFVLGPLNDLMNKLNYDDDTIECTSD